MVGSGLEEDVDWAGEVWGEGIVREKCYRNTTSSGDDYRNKGGDDRLICKIHSRRSTMQCSSVCLILFYGKGGFWSKSSLTRKERIDFTEEGNF